MRFFFILLRKEVATPSLAPPLPPAMPMQMFITVPAIPLCTHTSLPAWLWAVRALLWHVIDTESVMVEWMGKPGADPRLGWDSSRACYPIHSEKNWVSEPCSHLNWNLDNVNASYLWHSLGQLEDTAANNWVRVAWAGWKRPKKASNLLGLL